MITAEAGCATRSSRPYSYSCSCTRTCDSRTSRLFTDHAKISRVLFSWPVLTREKLENFPLHGIYACTTVCCLAYTPKYMYLRGIVVCSFIITCMFWGAFQGGISYSMDQMPQAKGCMESFLHNCIQLEGRRIALKSHDVCVPSAAFMVHLP